MITSLRHTRLPGSSKERLVTDVISSANASMVRAGLLPVPQPSESTTTEMG